MTRDNLNSKLLATLGELVHSTAEVGDTELWYRFRIDISPQLKAAITNYVREYNATHDTGVSVSFPKNYRMRIKAGRRAR